MGHHGGGNNFRGSLLVGNLIYAVIDNAVFTFPLGGGAGTQLTGTVLGTGPVTMARNNAIGPDIAIVAPGNGAYRINPQPVAATPPGAPTTPWSVTPNGFGAASLSGHRKRGDLLARLFLFSPIRTRKCFPAIPIPARYRPISMRGISPTAQSKPDTLYRPIPYNGQLLLCGANSD